MSIRVGSCGLDELVQVGEAQPAANDKAVYNSFMAVGSAAEEVTGGAIPVNGIINGLYGTFGINPVGNRPVYACPGDWEAIVIDRRTDWQLEQRLGIAAGVLLLIIIILKYK